MRNDGIIGLSHNLMVLEQYSNTECSKFEECTVTKYQYWNKIPFKIEFVIIKTKYLYWARSSTV